MNYVEQGATVYFQREKAKVIEEYQEHGKDYVVLSTDEGRRVVPFTSIVWNGRVRVVTPDGCQMAETIVTTDLAADSIRKQMAQWDKENPGADPRERKMTVKHCAFAVIETAAAALSNDKTFGFLVRSILKRIDDF